MYNYKELKIILVDLVDLYVHELLSANEEDDPLRVKRTLDTMEKCQVSLQWIDIYLRSSEQLKQLLQPILDYYLQSLKETIIGYY